MNERQLAAAIYRLSDPNHAKADLAFLVEKSPAIKSSPSFKTINFSPRHHHALILKLLLAVASEQEIEAHRIPDTKEKTPKPSPSPADKTKKTTSESATVPGGSAAGQNKKNLKRRRIPQHPLARPLRQRRPAGSLDIQRPYRNLPPHEGA